MASCINHALANEIFLAHTSRERGIDQAIVENCQDALVYKRDNGWNLETMQGKGTLDMV